MRQNSDMPRAARLAAALADMVADEGDATTVNGVSTYPDGSVIKADWMQASHQRTHRFLENEWWEWPVYEVNFAWPASARSWKDRINLVGEPGTPSLPPILSAPTSLAEGSTLLWPVMGWSGLCQRIIPDSSNDIVIDVTALVVMAIRYLPHSVQVDTLAEPIRPSDLATLPPAVVSSVTLSGMLSPLVFGTVFTDDGVALRRPHRLVIANDSEAAFVVGSKVTFGARTFRVASAPEVKAAGTVLEHAEVMLEETQFETQ